jgi:hypothetical protein
MSLLLKIDNLIEGTIVKRPSKFVKSPYVADIIPLLDKEKDKEANTILGHSAALGCCGLCDAEAKILMKAIEPKTKSKSKIQNNLHI